MSGGNVVRVAMLTNTLAILALSCVYVIIPAIPE
jgi:hypothetical protein